VKEIWMDSGFRRNDGTPPASVIPAKAGVHDLLKLARIYSNDGSGIIE